MARRLVFGDVFGDGSMIGARVSKPGFDAVTEPFGSSNIPFDTRYSKIGNVVASGLAQCGGPAIPFKTMSSPPAAYIAPWDGSQLQQYNIRSFGAPVAHFWYPAQAIVTVNSIQIVAFQLPYYNTLGFFNPNGSYFAFSIFGDGG